jgi:hypothetical protein
MQSTQSKSTSGDTSEFFAPERDIKSIDDCFFYHTMDLPGLGLMRGQ